MTGIAWCRNDRRRHGAREGSIPTDERRVAVITGAAAGIGRAIAVRLLEGGLAIVVSDLSASRLSDFADREDVSIVAGDITDAAIVTRLIDEAIARFGRIDVLVNNAGGSDTQRGVDECCDDEWAHNLALHVTAPFEVCRSAIPHMRAIGGGLIVNVSSPAGWTGGTSGAAYTASKHALVGLSKNIATMYVDDGIRCITVCPGFKHTNAAVRMAQPNAAAEASPRGEQSIGRIRDASPRRADPDELGELVAHLVRGGGALLNGAVLTADSGFSAYR
jgi:NAD(P)-dependent dehydrogenase (short-subunit alcohol dehydrogenase family)